MKRFEQAGRINSSRKTELGWSLIDTPDVQIELALFAYRKAHHLPGIDIAHWDKNHESIQAAAMTEWYGDPNDPTSFAARFRNYLKRNPYKTIDMTNNAELQGFLAVLAEEKGEIH